MIDRYNRLHPNVFEYFMIKNSTMVDRVKKIDQSIMKIRLDDSNTVTRDTVHSLVSKEIKNSKDNLDVDAVLNRVMCCTSDPRKQLDCLCDILMRRCIDEVSTVNHPSTRVEDVADWLVSCSSEDSKCYRRIYRIMELLHYFTGSNFGFSREDEEYLCNYFYSMFVASLFFSGDMEEGIKASNLLKPDNQRSLSTFRGLLSFIEYKHCGSGFLASVDALVGNIFSVKATITCKDMLDMVRYSYDLKDFNSLIRFDELFI